MIDRPDTSLSAIAARLTLLRRAFNLSQVEICRATGIKPTAWSNYETGSRRISIENARALRIVYGIGAEWIYWGDPIGLPHNLVTLLASPDPSAVAPTPALSAKR